MLDFGKEVGGFTTVSFGKVSDGQQQVGLAYSESADYAYCAAGAPPTGSDCVGDDQKGAACSDIAACPLHTRRVILILSPPPFCCCCFLRSFHSFAVVTIVLPVDDVTTAPPPKGAGDHSNGGSGADGYLTTGPIVADTKYSPPAAKMRGGQSECTPPVRMHTGLPLLLLLLLALTLDLHLNRRALERSGGG